MKLKEITLQYTYLLTECPFGTAGLLFILIFDSAVQFFFSLFFWSLIYLI